MLNAIFLSVTNNPIMLSVAMLNVAMLNDIILSVTNNPITQSVVMQNAIILNVTNMCHYVCVVAPFEHRN
jgi:hypothetical protein